MYSSQHKHWALQVQFFQKDKEEEARLRMLLDIPQEFIIIFCAVMGYASHNYLPPQRKY